MFGAVLVALALLAGLAPPEAKDAKAIVFCESYERAFQEATERGVPIMIAVIQDDEEANDDVWANTMNAPEFVAATQRTVNVVGNRGKEEQHGSGEEVRDGKKVKVCKRFGSISCADHVKAEVGIFRDFAREGMLKTPQVMLVLPDQTIVAALIDRHPLDEFLLAFAQAEKKLPNGLTQDEFLELRANLEKSKAWLEQGDLASVIEFALPYAKRKSSATFIQEAVGLLAKVEERGKEEMAAAEELIKAKDYVPAVARLEEIAGRFRNTVIEKVAKERRATLTKNREVKAALNAAKREETAREMLENADRLRDEGEAERAEKLYQRLLETFADTQAAAELKGRKEGG
ncbi:MAG: hypothetical protein HY812_01340 [Planctomycetes bacterium]|nr:hypothetical protein [Planctomycetota bacterium]